MSLCPEHPLDSIIDVNGQEDQGLIPAQEYNLQAAATGPGYHCHP